MIVLSLPICIFITVLTLIFIVWGFSANTVLKAVLALGLLVLLSSATATAIVSGFRTRLSTSPGAGNLLVQYAEWIRINFWIQLAGWPLLAAAAFAYWKRAFPKSDPSET
jgi:hypothetical protein